MKKNINSVPQCREFESHSLSSSNFLSEILYGFNYFEFGSLLLRKIFRSTNSSLLSFNSKYNKGFEYLLAELQDKGLIDSYRLQDNYNDYPKNIVCRVKFFTGEVVDGVRTVGHASSMVPEHVGLEICYSKVIGETLERHISRHNRQNSVPCRKIYKGRPEFSYAMVPQFSQRQKEVFPSYVQSEDDLNSLRCIYVKNVTKHRWALIPLQCMYYGYLRDLDEKLFVQGTTSGCGGGFTYEQAVLSAVYELIERDHFFLWWYSGLAPKKVVLNSGSAFALRVSSESHRYNLEVYFLDTTCDLAVKSCVCVIIDPVLSVIGMGAKAGISESIYEHAYTEALTLISSSRRRIESGTKGSMFFSHNDFTNIQMGQAERETQCCTQEAIAYIKKTFLSGQESGVGNLFQDSKVFRSETEEYKMIVAEFSRMSALHGGGYNLYLHAFESKWLYEYSYRVVRAYVPSFLALHLVESYAKPESARLRAFMESRGMKYSYDAINKVPHFFP